MTWREAHAATVRTHGPLRHQLGLLLVPVALCLIIAVSPAKAQRVTTGGPLTPTVPRFHRYAQTRLDDTTTLDMVKDAASGTCWLVYVKRDMVSYGYSVHSPATLGTVPCEPLPVR